jgi:hypothetical protein
MIRIRKPGVSSRLLQLTEEQREKLDQMLFVESRSYLETKNFLQSEFNVSTSISTLSKYYREEQEFRRTRKLLDFENRLLSRGLSERPPKVLLDVPIPAHARLRVLQIGAGLTITLNAEPAQT